MIATGRFFAGQETSADCERNFQGVEEIRRDRHDIEAFGSAVSGEVALVWIAVTGEAGERLRLLAPRAKAFDGEDVPLLRVLAQHSVGVDETFGIGEGQRAPELGFENAKDGGVGA